MAIKKCLVLDDEQHSIDILTEYISKTPGIELLKSLKNPIEAISLINSHEIDIAFIDVQMPNLTGLQFLKLLNKNTKVVLCTAYSEYAIDGFNLNVIDYLLKPISFERFIQSVQKIEQNNSGSLPSKPSDINDDYIFVRSDAKGKYIKISLKDILYIEGLGNYQKIQLADQQIVSQLKMKNLEDQLNQFGFLRVHKSFLVPIHKISQIEGAKIHIKGFKIPIGDVYKDGLYAVIGERILE